MIPVQPWVHSARFDLTLLLAPAWLVCLLALVPGTWLAVLENASAWWWLVLVVGVDVSHVYSTLFRTYLNPAEWGQRTALYVCTPLVSWLVGWGLYQCGSLVFWRAITYLAVFHFVRQPYGFMAIYARHDTHRANWERSLDACVIYAVTLLPLLEWHLHPKVFVWFIEGDFLRFQAPWLSPLGWSLYVLLLGAYAGKEVWQAFRRGVVNWPKNLLVAGTALSWYVGIVAFDSDLVFTATNVLAHGIPYIALIWLYGRNQGLLEARTPGWWSKAMAGLFQPRARVLYVGVLVMLAFLEEGLWDGLIWREHGRWFGWFAGLPVITEEAVLCWLVPLLAVPQITHYILDALIWRMHKGNNAWKTVLFHQAVRSS